MESTLGKRKERETDQTEAPHGCTLFISNLPYNATSVDLQTLFSDIAPVRSAFVVLEQGTKVSKGVGYVSFSIKEDAQAAYDQLSKDGISLVGRNLRVQWADNKPKENAEKVVRPKEPKARPPPRAQVPKTPHDPLAIRTAVVSGLPAGVDSKVLWKKFRKYAGAENVEWPIKTEAGEDATTAHVLFATPNAALDAVSKLHAHVFKGGLLSVTLKKRHDILSKPILSSSAKAKGTPAPTHASRLIVRNIPFDISEQDLRSVFLPYGPIHSIVIPTFAPKPSEEDEKPKTPKVLRKGFAFVWMLSKKDAEKAIEGCNGMVVRAGMAEGMVQDKQKKKKQRRLEKKMALVKKPEGEGDDEGDGHDDDVVGPLASERTIAVDWALSKNKWEEEKAKIDAVDDGDVEMGSQEEDDSASGSGSDSDSGSDSESDSDPGTESEDDGSDDMDEDHNDEVPMKPELPPPETGTTLFVRNVPFTATEDELRTLFRAFGPLRYARITMDPATGRSRGTGFACFWNKEDADKVIEQSELLRIETAGDAPKKNPFTLPSILTPDPSSSLARTLVLQGRTLDVVRAVTRDHAGKLKEEGEKRREKADKRNMYLLREGVILPNTPAASTIPAAELERRTASFTSRRQLLKTNPSLYISKTRLSVRQIPTFVTERVLRHLATHAVKTFEAEVASGSRAPLSADELADIEEEGANSDAENGKEKEKEKAKKKQGPRRALKQAKVVRQQERVDPVTGKGKSKGYGFIEMNTHADALRVLRWANNNVDVTALCDGWWKDELADLVKNAKAKSKGKGKEEVDEARLKRMEEELEAGKTTVKKSKGALIIEFSIENVQVVQRRSAIGKREHGADAEGKSRKSSHRSEERPAKKARISKDDAKPVKKDESKSSANESTAKVRSNMGSMIGRKRKERKAGKKGGH